MVHQSKTYLVLQTGVCRGAEIQPDQDKDLGAVAVFPKMVLEDSDILN